jgi:hypothetical protein
MAVYLRPFWAFVITLCFLAKVEAQEVIYFSAGFPLNTCRMTLNGNALTYSFVHTGALEHYTSIIFVSLLAPVTTLSNPRGLGDCALPFSEGGSNSCTIEGVVMLSDEEVTSMVSGRAALLVFLDYAPTDEFGVLWGEALLIGVYWQPDTDRDSLPDYLDQCPGTPFGTLVNEHGCSIEQLCPRNGPWKNHGEYLNHLKAVSATFVEAGLITEEQRRAILLEGAKSAAGRQR